MRCREVVLVLALSCTVGFAQEGIALPPLTPVPPSATNLLQDGSFEDPDAGAWRFSDWPPRPDTGDRLIADSIRFTDEQAADGERCLVFDLTTVGPERILLASQRFGVDRLEPWDGATMRLSGAVLLGGGPVAETVTLTLRLWGESGPPVYAKTIRMTADVNEWSRWQTEFVLHLKGVKRGDVNVGVRQAPDLTLSPIVYVDDVRLEALTTPMLVAKLAHGRALMTPDHELVVEVAISPEAWEQGLRHLRWDVTSPDGRTGFAGGEVSPENAVTTLGVPVPEIPEGRYALRLALGAAPGQRDAELLLPFIRAEGPFAR